MTNRLDRKMSHSRRVQKRSGIDIMASILNEAHVGTRKTRIMYRCNLSHRQLQVYLKLLLGMGFLAFHSEKDSNEHVLFETTVKGHKFMDAYRVLKALMT